MKKWMDVLIRSSLFYGMAEEDIGAVLECLHGAIQTFDKGSYLLRGGEQTEVFGILLSGRALIVQEDYWGNRNIVANITPGQLFAESFACSPGARLGVSVAAEEAGAVLWLQASRIFAPCAKSCSHHSQVIRNLVRDLSEKNLRFSEKLTHMGQRSTRDKLLSYLSAEARRHNSSDFSIPFSRQQLSDYLSVDRSGLSVQLGQLQKEGLLRFHKNHFTLLAPESAPAKLPQA